MSETPQEARDGVADAVRGLSDNTGALVRHEIAAAQREMLASAKQALPAIGLLAAASFFGVLSAAAGYRLSVRLLEKALPPATAASMAAVGYGMLAGAAGTIGVRQLRTRRPLVPAETVRDTVKTVADTAKTVADTTAKTARDAAKSVADTTAKTARDAAKSVADTTAKTAKDAAKSVADTTAKTAKDAAKSVADTTAKTARDTAKAATDKGKAAAGSTTQAASAARSRTRKASAPEQPETESES
jgi:hypothetical protein